MMMVLQKYCACPCSSKRGWVRAHVYIYLFTLFICSLPFSPVGTQSSLHCSPCPHFTFTATPWVKFDFVWAAHSNPANFHGGVGIQTQAFQILVWLLNYCSTLVLQCTCEYLEGAIPVIFTTVKYRAQDCSGFSSSKQGLNTHNTTVQLNGDAESNIDSGKNTPPVRVLVGKRGVCGGEGNAEFGFQRISAIA